MSVYPVYPKRDWRTKSRQTILDFAKSLSGESSPRLGESTCRLGEPALREGFPPQVTGEPRRGGSRHERECVWCRSLAKWRTR
ncbi:hypothetical protein DP115_09860 [Brasilonema octagenarum UFV-OR1]|uniref:Uncharacterized protein n=1 Tax=Brasilonema octagenarum UFV-OR1 TaxID=417115 RepID=A0ABX1M5T9_9CYAN|nr:hypothetical protein [Brasilonema octagenarum UFV-OR1]